MAKGQAGGQLFAFLRENDVASSSCSQRASRIQLKGRGRERRQRPGFTFFKKSSDLLVSPNVKSLATSTERPAYEATASAFLVLNEYWEGV